jgi:hypothetical protein
VTRATVAAACVLVLASAVASCAGDDDQQTATTADPATTTTTSALAPRLCAGGEPEQIGTVQVPELNELSGLGVSRTDPDVLWAHNDSGDSPRIFAMDRTGAPITTVDLDVATATDWEDLAIDGADLWLGDIGDNQRARPSITVHRVAEPALDATRATAESFELHYPDGAHDAEALMVDPVADDLVIVTKVPGGDSALYTTPAAAPGALRLAGGINLGPGQLVTAGDISAAGDTIVLRTYTGVFVWSRGPGEAIATALGRAPCAAPAPADRQGEAIALVPAGTAYLTTSEGAGSPLWQVPAGPPP